MKIFLSVSKNYKMNKFIIKISNAQIDVLNFFCIHYIYFFREREHICINQVKDKNIF